MAENQIYRLTDRQTLHGQECLNVYHYKAGAGDSSSLDLIAAFINDVFPAIDDIQNIDLAHVRLDCVNLDTGLDYLEYVHGTPWMGVVTGEAMPSFVAWGFRLTRADRQSRHGYKRIPGVSEGDINDGVATAPAAANLIGFAAVLAGTIQASGGNCEYTPVILKTTGTPADPVYTDYPIAGVQYVRVTSQVTRRVGRGS